MRFALHNLGCRVNICEGEAVIGMLKAEGFEEVDFTAQADIYIINTCSVTAVADKKSRQMIRRAKEIAPDAVVIAMGCFVNTAGDTIEGLPVDLAVGNNEKSRIPELIKEYFNKNTYLQAKSDIFRQGTPFEVMKLPDVLDHTRAFIKVQDGCDRFCSYCIIPYARGRARSMPKAAVLDQVRALAGNGYREIDISGIYLSGYGADTGSSLIELLAELQAVEGIGRIRMGSLEPMVMTEDFVREISSMEKLCPHFHLSLQSGSAGVLKRMNRHYAPAEYEACVDRLRRYYDTVAITTDVIAGFPGETEEEFEETLQFVKKTGFYHMHVFPYSRREGTSAAKMPGQLTAAEKKKRAGLLIEASDAMTADFEKSLEGKVLSVLFEKFVNGVNTGHTREYVPVSVRGADLTGEIREIIYSSHLAIQELIR